MKASTSTTKRENLLAVLRCEEPQWVPFAPNFYQWFMHHQTFKTLPPELRDCRDYIEAMKVLDCDIFSRNVDGGVRREDSRVKPRRSVQQEPVGPRTTISYETPYGTLSSVSQEQTALTTSHIEQYLVKDWATDGDAFRWLLEQRVLRWDEQIFMDTANRIGEDGLVNVPCECTPLKMLHQDFGLDYSCLFVADYPKAAKQLCNLYWNLQMLPVLKRLADHNAVRSVILLDNVDTPFYSPALAEEYWKPYVKEAATLMHSRGKTLFVHACGKLAGLSPVFAACQVNGLEGIAHPPLGDWPASQAQACHSSFIFIGGFSAREQDILNDDQVRLFYREYLPTMQKSRCIFSASCQTSIGTTWERLKLVRDICRQWGGRPHG